MRASLEEDHEPLRVMLVEDDESLGLLFRAWLRKAGMEVTIFKTVRESLRNLDATLCDVICLDIQLPDGNGLEVLDRVRRQFRYLPVVMTSAQAGADAVADTVRRGAYDYLTKPIERQRLITTVRNAVRHHRMLLRLAQLEQTDGRVQEFWGIKGDSPAMRRFFRELARVAASDVSVLVYGESGTGKELAARAIHDHSARSGGPFVAINCAAIPESLQDAELFGHEKGAFTGAAHRQPGRLEQADGGTLFLDELGELRPELQAKLLRALQERRFHRVGGREEIVSDFRLLAATHKDLREAVSGGGFREDLYFRVAVFELHLPPLREREGDVALLAQGFAQQLMPARAGAPGVSISSEAMRLLESHRWPGNVRELRNTIERALVVCDHQRICPRDLPQHLLARLSGHEASQPGGSVKASADVFGAREGAAAPPGPPRVGAAQRDASRDATDGAPDDAPDDAPPDAPPELVIRTPITLADAERQLIAFTLLHAQGNVSLAARLLGTTRSTLYRKLRQYDITS